MAQGTRLTVAKVKALQPKDTAFNVRDTAPHLFLTVNPSGKKTWYLIRKLDGKTRRTRLGSFPKMSPKAAREALPAALTALQRSIEENGTPKPIDPSTTRLADVWDRYSVAEMQELRSKRKYELLWKNHVSKLGSSRLSEMDVPTVNEFLRDVESNAGPAASNRCRSLIGTLWSVALLRGWTRNPSPTSACPRAPETERERYLEEDELQRLLPLVWDLEDDYLRDVILILIYTGCRKGNAVAMHWSELDLDAGLWKIPASKFKMKRPHTVPLVSTVVDILRTRAENYGTDGYVFPADGPCGYRQNFHQAGWPELLTEAGIEDFRPHDIRHTTATWCLEAGATEEAIAALLGHKRAGITARYARVRIESARVAAEKGENVFLRLSAGKSALSSGGTDDDVSTISSRAQTPSPEDL